MITVLAVLAKAVELVSSAYTLVVLAAVMMSWVRPDPMNPLVRWIRRLTEPPSNVIRRMLPFVVAGGIDFSPIVLLLLVQLGAQLVVNGLAMIANTVHG